MPTCPNCGKVTPQADATYCSYCGSSLQQAPAPSSFRSQPSQTTYRVGGSLNPNLAERYERALKRAERMVTVLLILGVVTLILLFI